MFIQEGFFWSILPWLSSSPLVKNFLKGKMEIKEEKNTCGWEEELNVFHTFVQGEHLLALNFLFRVLNIFSALFKNQWIVGV